MYHSCRLLYFVALAFLSMPAFSAVTIEAVRVGTPYSGPGNQTLFDATLKTTSSTPGVPTKYMTRAVPLSVGSAARLARGAFGGPLGLAVTAAMLANDLIVDNETGEILSNPGVTYDPSQYPNLECWAGSGLGTHCAPTRTIVCGSLPSVTSDCPAPYNLVNGSYCRTTSISHGGVCGPSGQWWRETNTGQGDSPGLPAPDEAVAEAVSPQQLRDLINDLLRRSPSRIPTVLPELAQEMEATKDAQEASEAHQADPENAPAPTPEQQETVDNSVTTDPGSGGGMAGDWPEFCSWATVVCDFIDWVREPVELPENVPVPMLDLDIPDYDSALPSTASCPAPVTVTTAGWGSFELSYQPFCDLAGYIRLGVLAIAYLFAAYTVVGVRR